MFHVAVVVTSEKERLLKKLYILIKRKNIINYNTDIEGIINLLFFCKYIKKKVSEVLNFFTFLRIFKIRVTNCTSYANLSLVWLRGQTCCRTYKYIRQFDNAKSSV